VTPHFRHSIGHLAIVIAILLILHGLPAQLTANESQSLIGDTPATPPPLVRTRPREVQACGGEGVAGPAISQLQGWKTGLHSASRGCSWRLPCSIGLWLWAGAFLLAGSELYRMAR
jgi:hypothetical protein